jgi:hypothetical protein
MKPTALIFLSFCLVASARAESLADTSGKGVLNAFLATYAKDEIAWKKDIHLNETPGQIAPGRELGQSAIMGYFSFVPKTWDDLTDAQKTDLIKDPRLRAFLISSRLGSLTESSSSTPTVFPIEAAKPSPPTPNPAPPQQLLIRISPEAIQAGQGLKVNLDK